MPRPKYKAEMARRAQAHYMKRQRAPISVIARVLDVRTELVRKWLSQPCPVIRRETGAEEWRLQAACRSHCSPNLWHPDWERDAFRGKVICHACPVQQACLEYAVTNQEEYGTWGGLSEWERIRLGLVRPRSHRPLSVRHRRGRPVLSALSLLGTVPPPA